jgi:hypothetical protein
MSHSLRRQKYCALTKIRHREINGSKNQRKRGISPFVPIALLDLTFPTIHEYLTRRRIQHLSKPYSGRSAFNLRPTAFRFSNNGAII